MAKNMARLEEGLKREQEEKVAAAADVISVRDLCVKLESSKEHLSHQLSSKSMEFVRVSRKENWAMFNEEILSN